MLTDSNIPVEIKVEDPKFIPMYQTANSAGADLVANIPPNDRGDRILTMRPGQIELVDVGFSMSLPEGWEAQIRPRSGRAMKGLKVANSPGTIDADFRDNVKVILHNDGKEIMQIKHGDRIAQMLLKPVWKFQWNIVKELSTTDRKGGFGSTGL